MSDQQENPDKKGTQQLGAVPGSQYETNDVSDDAQEALRQYNEKRTSQARAQEAPGDRSLGALVEGKVTLKFDVKGAATPVMVNLVDELMIGRRDPNGDSQPGLDLTVYGAYQMGVSRQHAAIRVIDGRLTLFDLGSRNGTYLNGHKVAPHQPTPLHSGDDMRIGKINMTLTIARK